MSYFEVVSTNLVPQIMTATVETVVEQLDLAPMIMMERALPAVARAVTLSDTDVGKFSFHSIKRWVTLSW